MKTSTVLSFLTKYIFRLGDRPGNGRESWQQSSFLVRQKIRSENCLRRIGTIGRKPTEGESRFGGGLCAGVAITACQNGLEIRVKTGGILERSPNPAAMFPDTGSGWCQGLAEQSDKSSLFKVMIIRKSLLNSLLLHNTE